MPEPSSHQERILRDLCAKLNQSAMDARATGSINSVSHTSEKNINVKPAAREEKPFGTVKDLAENEIGEKRIGEKGISEREISLTNQLNKLMKDVEIQERCLGFGEYKSKVCKAKVEWHEYRLRESRARAFAACHGSKEDKATTSE